MHGFGETSQHNTEKQIYARNACSLMLLYLFFYDRTPICAGVVHIFNEIPPAPPLQVTKQVTLEMKPFRRIRDIINVDVIVKMQHLGVSLT